MISNYSYLERRLGKVMSSFPGVRYFYNKNLAKKKYFSLIEMNLDFKSFGSLVNLLTIDKDCMQFIQKYLEKSEDAVQAIADASTYQDFYVAQQVYNETYEVLTVFIHSREFIAKSLDKYQCIMNDSLKHQEYSSVIGNITELVESVLSVVNESSTPEKVMLLYVFDSMIESAMNAYRKRQIFNVAVELENLNLILEKWRMNCCA